MDTKYTGTTDMKQLGISGRFERIIDGFPATFDLYEVYIYSRAVDEKQAVNSLRLRLRKSTVHGNLHAHFCTNRVKSNKNNLPCNILSAGIFHS